MKTIKYFILTIIIVGISNFAFTVKADVIKNPVIIIPGILGSWNMDIQFFDGTGGTWIFPPFFNPYSNLIEALEKDGYQKDKTLFVAFYDWRKSNITSATDYLIPVIDKALANSTTGKVDIIAHSMGGLIARRYIQSDQYRGDVENLILIGTPNDGASEAYELWEGGIIPKSFGPIMHGILQTYLSYSKIKFAETPSNYDVIHTHIPSIKELLPTYDFLYDPAEETYKSVDLMHEQNVFLQDLVVSRHNLTQLGSLTTIAGINHNTVDVISYGQSTNGNAKLWTDGMPNPLPPVQDDPDGDGTVLSWSATIGEGSIYPPILIQNPFQKLFAWLVPSAYADEAHIPVVNKTIDSTHLDLPTEVIPDIFLALGLTQPLETYEPISGPDEILAYMFASPVSVKITGPDGKSITSTTSTMSNAVYTGATDPNGVKIVFIANPVKGLYKVELTGTQNGHYHMAVLDENDATSTEQVVEKDVAEGEKISYTVNFDPQGSTSTTAISAPVIANATSTPTTTPSTKTAVELTQDLIRDVSAYNTAGKINKSAYKTLSLDLNGALGSLKEAEALKAKQSPRFPFLNSIAIMTLQRLAKIALDDFKWNVTLLKGKGVDAAIAPELIQKADAIISLIK